MSALHSVLDGITVASPCPARWETMPGSDRVRHCGQCRQRVYFLSGMTRTEAEALIVEKQGRLCVRYYQRPDGGVMTRDCPEGAAQKLRQQAAIFVGVALTLLFGLFAWTLALSGPEWSAASFRNREPFRTVMDWISPRPVVMGTPCVLPPVVPPVVPPPPPVPPDEVVPD
jgi:hypothetical protein